VSTGAILELLRDKGIETHLVMSKSAEMTLAYRRPQPKDCARSPPSTTDADIGASISSGPSPPSHGDRACSIKT